MLASVLVLASSSSTVLRGSVLLLAYSLGIGVAFLLAGIAFARAMGAFRWVRDHYVVIRVVERRDADRARSPALLREGLVAARDG